MYIHIYPCAWVRPILAVISNLGRFCTISFSFVIFENETFLHHIIFLYQINIITSYIDASNVYGSTKELANRLRAKGGLLDVRFFTTSRDQPVLPPDDETFCRSVNREEEPCFLAGDVRANENHGKPR